MARPLKINGTSGLKQMTDGELDRLQYNIRKRYASFLQYYHTSTGVNALGVQTSSGNGPAGALNVGSVSGWTSIGSATDTISTQQTATNPRNNSGGDDYPASPGIGSSTVTTYNYFQNRSATALGSAFTGSDQYSYLKFVSPATLRTASDYATDFFDEIITQCITDMYSGDEVGSYRVSTSAPSSGGAGTWVDCGTFHSDTTYSAGTTTHKLWVKTALTSVPGTDVKPVMWNGTLIKEVASIDETGSYLGASSTNFIDLALIPALVFKVAASNLQYSIVTSAPAGSSNRGSFTDTRQTGSTDSQSFSDPTYSVTSTPSGSASVQTTNYLSLAN
tara:strand:+ start:7647 stop:8645 length:999 start_codon:yes stop_codon:yes gene_type:complete